jgi:hypothetical protein
MWILLWVEQGMTRSMEMTAWTWYSVIMHGDHALVTFSASTSTSHNLHSATATDHRSSGGVDSI